ncbi:MAG: tRNA 2-thiouridine(34) synthase MnmA [Candidatus Kaiserbacteria bacterium]|nr:MAG: tRNA 2-thiouridine(34) synthase MnmA [Candidatus Kaiserbacteria bacterium]
MQKVFVGLSGGVDSAVSAALLKDAGYEVVGAFIKIWQPEFTECTWREDRLDAMRVCAALEIPFKEIDLSEEYKREVVEEMVRDYERGITPNPDVLCNRSIKFGHFARWAHESGADKIATGHYARISDDRFTKSLTLRKGVDPAKDQSYFLYRLTKEDLERTLFPVGALTKSEVRVDARRRDLPVAQKHDSQGLCFVGDVSIPEFLSRYIALKPGDVLDGRGNVIGNHSGAALYTLGQRHGFLVQKGDTHVPHYVVAIDVSNNTITVSSRKTDAATQEAEIENVSWVDDPPENGAAISAVVRYREEPVGAVFADKVVRFDEPRIATPGQSIALYRGDEIVGGGTVRPQRR